MKVKDGMVICDKKMIEAMKSVAEAGNIPIQYEVLESGGTDTCMLQQAAGGCVAGALSVPTRYGHSAVEVIDMNDVSGGVKILAGLCGTRFE